MNLVYETDNPQIASKESQDWKDLGYKVIIKEKRKHFKGFLTTVYHVWVKRKPAKPQQFHDTIDELNMGALRCKKCNQLVSTRFPVCLCGYAKADI